MTVRALIAEDEPVLAQVLQQSLLRLWPGLDIVAICPNGIDAVEKTLALRPDVLFVDIKMPGKTGLEAIEELSEEWDGAQPFPQVVFVTAYDDYAVEAFEHAAADYVLKPVNDERLAKTIERVRSRLAQAPAPDMAALLGQMRALLPAAPRLSVIRAAVGAQVRMIPIADVVYFEALDKYVNVVTADSEALIRLSLKDLLPQLDDSLFWQIHRSTIVNSSCVASASRDDTGKVFLTLRNRAEKLRVTALYAHLFRQM